MAHGRDRRRRRRARRDDPSAAGRREGEAAHKGFDLEGVAGARSPARPPPYSAVVPAAEPDARARVAAAGACPETTQGRLGGGPSIARGAAKSRRGLPAAGGADLRAGQRDRLGHFFVIKHLGHAARLARRAPRHSRVDSRRGGMPLAEMSMSSSP